MTHILGYGAVVADAIERAVEYCEERGTSSRTASDMAYGFQYIVPGDETGRAQAGGEGLFWRLVYRRMIGAQGFPSGVGAQAVDVPDLFIPEA
jgi:hypothetical protein